jgi:hypothetical protein
VKFPGPTRQEPTLLSFREPCFLQAVKDHQCSNQYFEISLRGEFLAIGAAQHGHCDSLRTRARSAVGARVAIGLEVCRSLYCRTPREALHKQGRTT